LYIEKFSWRIINQIQNIEFLKGEKIMDLTKVDNILPVLDYYSLKINKIYPECIRHNRAVWWVETNEGLKVLKKLPGNTNRVQFIITAIIHLQDNKINIPKIHKTSSGKHFVMLEDNNFILFDAIKGKSLNYDDNEDLNIMVNELAKFHKASKGFNTPEGVSITSRLGKWPKMYSDNYQTLENLYNTELEKDEHTKFGSVFMEIAPKYLSRIEDLRLQLDKSEYLSWVKKTERSGGLGHFDFKKKTLS